MEAQRQRHAAVRADVARNHDLPLNAIDNQLFIQQHCFHRRGANIFGAGDRMPAAGQA
jgi:hypothetical protein